MIALNNGSHFTRRIDGGGRTQFIDGAYISLHRVVGRQEAVPPPRQADHSLMVIAWLGKRYVSLVSLARPAKFEDYCRGRKPYSVCIYPH